MEWRPSGQVDSLRAKDNDGNKKPVGHILETILGVHTPPNQPTNCSSGTQATIPRYFEFRRLSH